MKMLTCVKNLKGKDSSEIVDGILNKVFLSAYGKDIRTVTLTPIKNNEYCNLQVVVNYTIDKRKKALKWRLWKGEKWGY